MSKIRLLFEGFQFRGNLWVVLILRLLLVMLLFTLCRLGFYFYNRSYFPDMSLNDMAVILQGGLRFDLTAVLYTNLLFIFLSIIPFKFRFNTVYQRVLKWLFFIFNGVALATNVADFIYFKFTGRRTTADVFQQFENEQNMPGLLLRFLFDYWYALLFWISIMALMVWLYNRIRLRGPMLKNNLVFYISGVLAMPLAIYLFVGGVRGGFRHSTRPITLNDAGKYVNDPKDISMVLNTPFAIYRTTDKTQIKRMHYFETDAQLEAVFTPVRHGADSGEMKKLNVVVLVIESFSKDFIGYFNHWRDDGTYKGYTPFLDSLLQYSRSYEYSLASGRRSIDALPSVMTSFPAMGVSYILSPYSGNRTNSLASLLKPEGYGTSFFHGAPNGSMGFESFMHLSGVDHYYGMTEYGNNADFDGWWGIWDEKFMTYMADTQKDFKEPFVSAFFSLSSHHPFNIPDQYKDVFKGGDRGPILKCVQYTDNALRKYFNQVSRYPWFKNTLFVITADHTSSNSIFDDSQTARGLYSIPIIFYRPDNSLAGLEPGLVHQADIMPTVMGYLGYKNDFIAFGNDVFTMKEKNIAFNYKDDVYQLFKDNYLLQFDGRRSVGLYDFKKDRLCRVNLIKERPEVVPPLENLMKAIIQQYNNRMIENKLTVAAGQ